MYANKVLSYTVHIIPEKQECQKRTFFEMGWGQKVEKSNKLMINQLIKLKNKKDLRLDGFFVEH